MNVLPKVEEAHTMKNVPEWAQWDRRKSLKDISRYSSRFFKRREEKMKLARGRICKDEKVLLFFAFHFCKCKNTQMKFILLMNFSFVWKTFFCARRVIKYKFEFVKWVHGKSARRKSGKSTNRLFFIINSYRR